MLTSYCRTCCAPKEPANYADFDCPTCITAKNEAMQNYAAEHAEKIQSGEITNSDVLYVGRQALMARAHHANRNFVDPRGFSRAGGFPR